MKIILCALLLALLSTVQHVSFGQGEYWSIEDLQQIYIHEEVYTNTKGTKTYTIPVALELFVSAQFNPQAVDIHLGTFSIDELTKSDLLKDASGQELIWRNPYNPLESVPLRKALDMRLYEGDIRIYTDPVTNLTHFPPYQVDNRSGDYWDCANKKYHKEEAASYLRILTSRYKQYPALTNAFPFRYAYPRNLPEAKQQYNSIKKARRNRDHLKLIGKVQRLVYVGFQKEQKPCFTHPSNLPLATGKHGIVPILIEAMKHGDIQAYTDATFSTFMTRSQVKEQLTIPGSDDEFDFFDEPGFDEYGWEDGLDTWDATPSKKNKTKALLWELAFPSTSSNGRSDEFKEARFKPTSHIVPKTDEKVYTKLKDYIEIRRLPSLNTNDLVNYFAKSQNTTNEKQPVTFNTSLSECPWNSDHLLLKVSYQTRKRPSQHSPVNMVLLLDESASMFYPSRHEVDYVAWFLKAFKPLLSQLGSKDHVAIIAYQGMRKGLVLPPTSCDQKDSILAAFERQGRHTQLNSKECLTLAYRIAEERHVPNMNTQVLLVTDGDFHFGFSSDAEYERLLANYADRGVALSCVGLNMKHKKQWQIKEYARLGNGYYAYPHEPEGLLEYMEYLLLDSGEFLAKNVRFKIDFNPQTVASYRFVGKAKGRSEEAMPRYFMFNLLPERTFTAFFEIIPQVSPTSVQLPSEYIALSKRALEDEICNLAIRHTDGTTIGGTTVKNQPINLQRLDPDTRFAVAVAYFGEFLKAPELMGSDKLEEIIQLAVDGLENDPYGRRVEFINLVKRCRLIKAKQP